MVTQFETLIDDSHDTIHTYQLMNQARMIIEHIRPWEILKAVDETQTRNVGDTYLSMKTVNANARTLRYIIVGTRKYRGVPFEERILYKDSANRYYVDWANMQFALTGRGAQQETIVQVYTKRTTRLTDGGTAWVFPEDYHDIIPHIMAGIHQGIIDPDEIASRQALTQNVQVATILRAMESWDDELKMSAQDDRLTYADDADEYGTDLARM